MYTNTETEVFVNYRGRPINDGQQIDIIILYWSGHNKVEELFIKTLSRFIKLCPRVQPTACSLW